MRTNALTLLAAGILLASPAAAQPAPAPPAPAGDAADDAQPADADPKIPEVDDPMLQVVPPARRVLSSWQQALRLVRNQSSNLRVAAAQVEQAAGQSRQALAGALPTLTGTGNINHHLLRGEGVFFDPGSGGLRQGSIPDPATTWNAGLNLRVPVFAPKAWYDHGTAKRAVDASRLSAKEAERQVLAATAEAIVSVVTAERLAEVSRVSLTSALSTLDLNKRRAQLGAASAFDVLRAEQEVALSRAQVVTTNESVRKSREALGLALGANEPYGVTPNLKLDGLARDAASSCRLERSVSTRPDVLAARANVELAQRAVKSVDWTYAPTVDFLSNLTYWSDADRTANGKSVTWTIGGTLTWVLYDGGLRYGTRQANHGQLRLAQEQLTQAKRQANFEVVQARRQVQVSESTLAVSQNARDLARKSARLARIAFLNGTGTSFDLIDSAKRLREAEIDLAVKEFELVRSRVLALLALATCDV